MKQKQALKTAIDSMRKEYKTLAVQGNLYAQYGMASGMPAHLRREKLQEAILILLNLAKEGN